MCLHIVCTHLDDVDHPVCLPLTADDFDIDVLLFSVLVSELALSDGTLGPNNIDLFPNLGNSKVSSLTRVAKQDERSVLASDLK